MNLRCGLRALAIMAALGTAAHPAGAETLREALAQTYDTNPDISAARAQVRATDEGVPQALSSWRPTVLVNGSYQRRDRETRSGPQANNRNYGRTVSLNVRQNIFRGYQVEAETSRARNLISAGRANLIGREQEALLEAAVAYMDVVRNRAILGLRENNVRVLGQQRQATGERFEVGELTRTDVAQADSRLAQAVSDRIAAQGELNSSIADYAEVVGTPPGDLADPGLPQGLPGSGDEAAELAKENNPDVTASGFAERAARDNIDLMRGGFLPALTLDGEILNDSDRISTEKTLTLNVTVPLYRAGSVYSRVRQAKHTANQRLLELAERERESQEAARQSWAALESARARITSLEAEVRAQEIAFEGVRQEAQVGSRTVLDVLDAEQELLDARVGLVQAQRNHIVAAYRLLAAVGRLTARDLELEVELYDPVENFNAVEGRFIGTDIQGGDDNR